MKAQIKNLLLVILLFSLVDKIHCQVLHPKLILTPSSVQNIRNSLGKYPLLDSSYYELKRQLDNELSKPVDVPVPTDAGGGYTHETHKSNAQLIYKAGIVYQISNKKLYADFVKHVLLAYSKLYPKLTLHPQKKDQSPGKLFWQNLNESVWLCYTIQAYDCIYDYLSVEERKDIENSLIRPVARFLSDDSPQTFNWVHNHGTWAVAAVGMAGYVLGDAEMVQKSLKGLLKNGEAGYFKQLDQLFSPTGYYTEGAYYQRYAILPFIWFALAIDNNDPQLNIFKYRQSIFRKAVYTTLQMTNGKGEFFPFNDALKDKTWLTTELTYAVNACYSKYPKEPQLLSVVKRQGRVMISAEGLEAAKDIHDELSQSFQWKSLLLTDGAHGKSGGLSIIRSGTQADDLMILFKYASQGMGHGHYDRLSLMMYDNGEEILQDYGAARFLNIEPKYGGHYLPENKTWAKQSIAHNTLVVDGKSHFHSNLERASLFSPDLVYADVANDSFQISIAKEDKAYDSTKFIRTVAVLKEKSLEYPLVLDILKASSQGHHAYDLPYYYKGHFISKSFDAKTATQQQTPLGKSYGYEHLWVKGTSDPINSSFKFTWLQKERFYTISSVANLPVQIFLTQVGANDPDFNLRPENGIMLRTEGTGVTYFSVVEPHGRYDAVNEVTRNVYSAISEVQIVGSDNNGVVVKFSTKDKSWLFAFAQDKKRSDDTTIIKTLEGDFTLKGAYELREINK